MPTQKTFKHRVRTRMNKTGESYTAARRQLLSKAADADPATEATAPEATAPEATTETLPAGVTVVSDDALVRATGRTHVEWFALLDAWGATGHTHTEIAAWLSETHGVRSWWTQSVTVAYERARGMRARHEMADGFSVSVTRTVPVGPEAALDAVTDPVHRERWLPGAPMTPRPTRAKSTARFDWATPASRVVVTVAAKGADKSVVAVSHERLPDAETGERLKASWRTWLDALKGDLAGG